MKLFKVVSFILCILYILLLFSQVTFCLAADTVDTIKELNIPIPEELEKRNNYKEIATLDTTIEPYKSNYNNQLVLYQLCMQDSIVKYDDFILNFEDIIELSNSDCIKHIDNAFNEIEKASKNDNNQDYFFLLADLNRYEVMNKGTDKAIKAILPYRKYKYNNYNAVYLKQKELRLQIDFIDSILKIFR